MVFMWTTSFSLFAGQYLIGDVFGIELTNFYGNPIRSHLAEFVQIGTFNVTTESIIAGNITDIGTANDGAKIFTANPAIVVWEFVQLLSGTYVFNLLFLLGVSAIVVVGMVSIYTLLLARAIVGYVRGV